MAKTYRFTDAGRAVLEARCNEVAKNSGNGCAYFVGSTADADGEGHALIEVDETGAIIRRWGSVDDHLKYLHHL